MKKLKVNDTVKIKSLDWYNKSTKDFIRRILLKGYPYSFVEQMSTYCGKRLTITSIYKIDNKFCYEMFGNVFIWCDFMFDLNEQLEFDFNEKI